MRPNCIVLLVFMLVSLAVSDADDLDDYVTKMANEFINPQQKMPGIIRFDAVRENLREEGDAYAIGIKLKLLLNDTLIPKYTIGSVGIGYSLYEAVDNSIKDWVTIFLSPFRDYLQNSPNVLPIGAFRVYPSVIGFRWTTPPGWVLDTVMRHNKFLSIILPHLDKNVGDYPAIVYLMLIVDESGKATGQCHVNSEQSNSLLAELIELDWPVTSDRYMLKQLYVIEKKPMEIE